MHHLTPRFILDQWDAGRRFGRFRASTLFVDISGFTAVTEALMDAGIAGGEMLADIMVAIFDPLIAAVYENGGFVSGFAGDAFTAIFPDGDAVTGAADSAARAVTAGWRINRHLNDYPTYTTDYGTFAFTVKVGAARGSVVWGIVGAADGLRTYYFRGEAVDGCAAAEHVASGGDVVLSAEVAAAVAGWASFRPIGHAHFVVRDASPPVYKGPVIAPPEDDQAASAFQPAPLLHSDQRGEFRDVFSVFLNVQGPLTDAQLVPFMETFFDLLRRYDGTLCRLDFGDKGCNLLLFWGAPTSNENDAQRVLDFALDLVAATDLTLRVGVTFRMAYAGFAGAPRREEYTCYGLGVNLAARQMMAATWGAILLDGDTVRKATGFAVRYLEHKPFKGFAEPQPVYTLLGRDERTGEPHYAGRLVGRERELAQLEQAIRPIFDHRFAGLVAIVGEAGLGKSRLAHALVEDHAADLLLCQTDEILRQSLNPFRSWMRHEFDQSTTVAPAENRRRFEARLQTIRELTPDDALRIELTRTHSFLAALLDIVWPDSLYAQLEPELRFENTLSALKTLIKALSLIEPVVVLLEDAHWLDADSAEFLRRLTRNVAGFPFAVVATSRSPVDSALVADGTPCHTITLGNLQGAALSTLVSDRLQQAPSTPLLDLLRSRTDGNPFFVEQMLLYLRENDLLDRLQQEDSELDSDILVPTDVRSLLVSRLDKLEPAVRDVVQQAAVLGREFDAPVLAAMVGMDVGTWTDSAETAAIWQRVTTTRYLFQHALMRDAAYDMQLRGRLRSLHRHAAHAFETLHERRYFSAPPYAEIAYHFDHAREATRAVDYYGKAGEQAQDAYHNEDAVAYFTRGLELSDQSEDTHQFALLSGREAVYSWVGERNRQLDDLLQLVALAEERGDSAECADVYLRLAFFYHVTGEYEQALRYTRRAQALSETLDDDALLFRIYHTWGRILWKQGRYVDARPQLQTALSLAQDASATADCLYDLGVTYFYQTSFAEARTYIERAVTHYAAANNDKGLISCLIVRGNIEEQNRRFSRANVLFKQALQQCRNIGWRYGESFSLEHLGNNSFNSGLFDQAEQYHRLALSLAREIGLKSGEAVSHDVLGLIHLFEGRPAAAQTQFQIALDLNMNGVHDSRSAAFTFTHLGHALTELGQHDRANEMLIEALAIRRNLDLRGLMLDTLSALALNALREGKHDTARSWLTRLVAEMDDDSVSRAEFPLLVYWTAYHVMTSLGENRTMADELLARGHALLQQNAAHIQEQEDRSGYLTAFPFHAALVTAWQAASRLPSS